MCRAGGPRCSGKAKTTASTTTTTTTTAATVTSPARDDVDRMAAALPADRTGWDGKPLDESGRRLYALRESGYSGPIDQDGYPDTTSEAAGILRRMAHDRGERTDW